MSISVSSRVSTPNAALRFSLMMDLSCYRVEIFNFEISFRVDIKYTSCTFHNARQIEYFYSMRINNIIDNFPYFGLAL